MVAQPVYDLVKIYTFVFRQTATPIEAPICLLPVMVPAFLGTDAGDVSASSRCAISRFELGGGYIPGFFCADLIALDPPIRHDLLVEEAAMGATC